MADAKRKGRTARGIKNAGAKLSESDVYAIREFGNYMTGARIAEIFGVSKPLISFILNKKRWKHI